MRPIYIGKNPDGAPLYLTPELRKQAHFHCIGGTRTGKSKFLEWMIRQDIDAGHGLCVIDYHGKLYHDLLRWCLYNNVGVFNDCRKLILINPSEPQFVTAFNPFGNRHGDLSTQVSNRLDMLLRAWGARNTDQTPMLEATVSAVFFLMAENGETLPNAAKVLDFGHRKLVEYAASVVSDYDARATFLKLGRIAAAVRAGKQPNPRSDIRLEADWDVVAASTYRRLSRLTRATGIKRFMGLNENAIDIESLMQPGNIILVNLGQSDNLPQSAAKVFASLFVLEFFETAIRRSNKLSYQGDEPPTFLLYLDEFQNYINEDIADSLDQALKGGLHMILAHQHLGHFKDNERLADSIFTNARLRAVFGGLKRESAEIFADLMFLPDLTARQVVKAFHTIIHLYEEQYRTTTSSTRTRGTSDLVGKMSGRGNTSASASVSGMGEMTGHSLIQPMSGSGEAMEGWSESDTTSLSGFSSEMSSRSESEFEADSKVHGDSQSEGEGETRFPVWVPIPKEIVTHEEVMSIEEKRLKIVQMLNCQMKQHCFIKLDIETTQPMWVPFVSAHRVSMDMLGEYETMVYEKQGSLSAKEVDALLIKSEQNFLQRAERPSRPSRGKAPEAPQMEGHEPDPDDEYD
jgi:hypothetical protein